MINATINMDPSDIRDVSVPVPNMDADKINRFIDFVSSMSGKKLRVTLKEKPSFDVPGTRTAICANISDVITDAEILSLAKRIKDV